jgi:hypothetical protein
MDDGWTSSLRPSASQSMPFNGESMGRSFSCFFEAQPLHMTFLVDKLRADAGQLGTSRQEYEY